MQIKTIFFDFGGVIIKPPNANRINRLKKFLSVEIPPELQEMFQNPNQSKLIRDMCLGILPEKKIWEIMADEWHFRPSIIRRIRRKLLSKRQLNQPLIKFMQQCQQQFKTAILSNAGDQTRSLMEDVYNLDQYVDEIIISAEEGVIKPDPEIYRIALKRVDADAETSILLDDTLENILSARQMGMKAIQFINNEQSITMMRELLFQEK